MSQRDCTVVKAVPPHCGEWEERVVLGSVLVSQDSSIPLWCIGRKNCTGQCVGQWFHSTGEWVERAVLGSGLVSQDSSIPLWCMRRKNCTGQCIGQWFHSTVVRG